MPVDIDSSAPIQSSAQKRENLTLLEDALASRRKRLISIWKLWNESSPKLRRRCRTCGNDTRAGCAHYIPNICGGCGKSGHRARDCNQDPVPIKMNEEPEFLKRKELKEAEVAAFEMKKLGEAEGASVKRKKSKRIKRKSTGSSSSKGEEQLAKEEAPYFGSHGSVTRILCMRRDELERFCRHWDELEVANLDAHNRRSSTNT